MSDRRMSCFPFAVAATIYGFSNAACFPRTRANDQNGLCLLKSFVLFGNESTFFSNRQTRTPRPGMKTNYRRWSYHSHSTVVYRTFSTLDTIIS
jgi:hypothetical protein